MDAQTLFLLKMTVYTVFAFITLLILAGMSAVCQKAEQPGWSAIIPGYNLYVLTLAVARIDLIWFFLALIPGLGFFAWGVICNEIARRFHRGIGFAIGLSVAPMLFWPILGYNDDRYIKKLKSPKPSKRWQDLDKDDEQDDDREITRTRRRTDEASTRAVPKTKSQ